MRLPKKLKIDIKELEIDELICDYLSDTYGYCINGLDFAINGNQIVCENIDWDTSE